MRVLLSVIVVIAFVVVGRLDQEHLTPASYERIHLQMQELSRAIDDLVVAEYRGWHQAKDEVAAEFRELHQAFGNSGLAE